MKFDVKTIEEVLGKLGLRYIKNKFNINTELYKKIVISIVAVLISLLIILISGFGFTSFILLFIISIIFIYNFKDEIEE